MTLGTGSVVAAFQTAAAGSAASIVTITRIELTQNHNTTTAMCLLAFSTRSTAGTLTMTSTTPQPIQPVTGSASGLTGNTAPAGGTGRSGTNSSADSGGTYTDHRYANFANLNGYLWKPDGYGEAIVVPPSTLWCVRFVAAPGDTAGWTIAIDLDEAG
jgi:hypothetical protein